MSDLTRDILATVAANVKEIGNGKMRDLESTNAALTKRVAEGAYYVREDGQVFGPAARELCDGFYFWRVGPCLFTGDGGSAGLKNGLRLTRRVYLVHTDPAWVVEGLQHKADRARRLIGESSASATAFDEAKAFVAERLIVGDAHGLTCGELLKQIEDLTDENKALSTKVKSLECVEFDVRAKTAEVVAELRELQLNAHVDAHSEFGGRTDEAKEQAFCEAADLVAEKLDVK